MPAVSSRYSARKCGARLAAARATVSGKRVSWRIRSCSSGALSRRSTSPDTVKSFASTLALRKMLIMRACAYCTL
jgi:hypothetical protein